MKGRKGTPRLPFTSSDVSQLPSLGNQQLCRYDSSSTLLTVCVCVCVRVYHVCVLVDSSALSQSSAAEEMPPLLPSPQSSPASKLVHGLQTFTGGHWQGPAPCPSATPPSLLPPWLVFVTSTSGLPHSDPPSFLKVPLG